MLQVKQYRKDIADLLRQGKKDYARIRVEAVIRENLMLQALEVLELYLELIAVRSQLISQTKEIPRDMIEAISSVIYSAQRVSGAYLGLAVLVITVEAPCQHRVHPLLCTTSSSKAYMLRRRHLAHTAPLHSTTGTTHQHALTPPPTPLHPRYPSNNTYTTRPHTSAACLPPSQATCPS